MKVRRISHGDRAPATPPRGEGDGPGGLRSADNALRLVLLFQEHEELRLSDVAVELGVANSTAHRLLSTLVNRGFVIQDQSRAYHRGPALAKAGTAPAHAANRPRRSWSEFVRLAHRHLVRMSELTRETCHFIVLEGNGARFLDCVVGSEELSVGPRTGMLLPAHTNSGGKALLARLSEAELHSLYPRALPPGGGRAATDLASLHQELAATRRRGYGINIDESARGVSAVGAALFDTADAAFGAMVIAVPTMRCPPDKLRQLGGQLIESTGSRPL